MRGGFINPRVHQPEERKNTKRKTLRESVPVSGFVIRQVSKRHYLLFVIYVFCYLSMYLVRFYLSLMTLVLRQVIVYTNVI